MRMYVERSELEASLKGAMNDSAVEPNGIYLIVYGPKGTGKTTTVNHLAQMSPEAMVIQVADTTLEATILDSIARKKSFQYDTGSRESFTEAFKSHTQKITTTHTVIVFDVLVSWNDDAESKGLGMVTSLSKEFADFCEVVVLIHNPSAAILLNTDTYSRQFICVEDFSEEEAIQFCQNLVPELPVEDDELHQLFATVGTRPTMLIRLHQDLISGSVESIDPFIYDVLYRAETDLRSFKYQSLIRKLKDSPNGVSDLDMQNEVEDGVQLCNALDVAPALRASQAVYYNVEHGLYMLQSQAHRTALERMMLPDPPVWSSSHSN